MTLTQFIKPLATSAFTIGLSLVAASAQAFTFKTSGAWSNPVGSDGTSVEYQLAGQEKQIRWGTPAPGSFQSGLGFTGNADNADFGDVFRLGKLQYFNTSLSSGPLSSVDLTISLSFGNSLSVPDQTFTFPLKVEETPNIPGQCPYPGSVPCSDKLSFSNTTSSQTFLVNGVGYSLELLGFRPPNDNSSAPINQVIGQENAVTPVFLYGRVVEVTQTPPSTAAVPEPTTMVGLALASAGISWVRRKRSPVQDSV